MPLKLLKIVNTSNALNTEQLKALQNITQQAVFSIESFRGLEESQKRNLVKIQVEEMILDMGLLAPPLLLEVAVEANLLLFDRYGKPLISSSNSA